jgi:hypothetical protein
MNGLRLDLLLAECVGTVVKQVVEPRCGNAPIWDSGAREVALEKLHELGVPKDPLTLVDIARHVGFLGPDPTVIVVNPPRKRGRSRGV